MSRTFTVTLPDIGEGVVEGEVIEWLKQVGEEVHQDEPIVVVMTDKATVELPAPTPGKLLKQYYPPGQMAQKGQPLYDLETEGEEKKVIVEKKEAPILLTKPTEQPQSGTLAIPAVRKMARDLGIDLTQVTGTGPKGQITSEDLRRHLSKPEGAPILCEEGDQITPLVGIRHQMARHMKESHEIIPHFSYFEQADATRLIGLKEHIKEEAKSEGITMTFMPLFIRALSLTLTHYPQVNSSYNAAENQWILHQHHNIAVAFSTPQGLLVPVLHQVEKLHLPDIIRHYDALKKKVADNKLTPTDMRGGTLSISNYGVLGNGLFATPIIHFPQVAILALAKIQKQPFVKNEQVVACDLLNLSWSFDHRVIDGELGAAFSHYFCSLIQNPAQLL